MAFGTELMDRAELLEVDPEKMSGVPCFTGTRVPVTHLFDYLKPAIALASSSLIFRP
jgi:uncharacterized protein (DUF433 family)